MDLNFEIVDGVTRLRRAAAAPQPRPAASVAAGIDTIDFGMTASAFRRAHFEQKPYLHKCAISRTPFSWSELDELLHRIEPRAPVFQLFHNGLVEAERYTQDSIELGRPRQRLDKPRFYEQLRKGATLVINGFESYSLRAKRWCGAVGRFARSQAIGNAYLSLGGRGTFGRHWDTHDVFALQLIGRKRWRVFAPTFPLPLGMHDSAHSGQACPTEAVLDCVLEAGDLLYVPRGWWHEAIPFDEASLHLSVGSYGPSIHDYLVWACARHLPELQLARQSMSANVDIDKLRTVLGKLGDIVFAEAYQEEFLRDIVSQEVLSSEFDAELFLQAGTEGLRPDAVLRLTSSYPPNLQGDELVVNGTRLRLESQSLAVVALLAETPQLSMQTLYERLPTETQHSLRCAVFELARHDVVSIERKSDRS
jgi:ribosomal protein L16 Arg81 hydroxylase